MEGNGTTGVFFCTSTHGNGAGFDRSDLIEYARGLPGVKGVWDLDEGNLKNPEAIARVVEENHLKRLVIAGSQPGWIKPLFARGMAAANQNAEDIHLAAFAEYGAVTPADSEQAKAILACAVYNVGYESAARGADTAVHADTLVIGAGIAGIQAALEIADAKQTVHLVEKSGTIGGHMAMFDKTFPTLDCAACILTPKMVEVGQHPFINLMTTSEVLDVQGEPGNYQVKILKKTRRVDLDSCISCGQCSEKCPAAAPSEFDAGTTTRKAIYIPFAQAVPNKYLIDPESCIYVQKGKCGVCAKICPADCIDLDAKDEEVEITVGNIVVATGFKVFDARRAEQFGYGVLPNVVTSLEFERLVNAGGPTGGKITFRGKDKRGNAVFSPETDSPKSVALIHCIGSRDQNYNAYCSRVCCMYSLKLAHLVKEKLPDAEVFEYYIDMRAFGKGYEEFYERIKNEGIQVIRGRSAKIEAAGNGLLLRSEDMVNDELIEQPIDMAILAVGLEPNEDTAKLADTLGLPLDKDGWLTEYHYSGDPVATSEPGVTIAGVCQGPKDIPDSVAQGSAAASRVLRSIMKGKMSRSGKTVSLTEIENRARELAGV